MLGAKSLAPTKRTEVVLKDHEYHLAALERQGFAIGIRNFAL